MKLNFLFGVAADPSIKQMKDFISHLPIFQGLTSKQISHLLGILQTRTYLKGETLFSEGDIGRALFIVVSGTIELVKKDTEGRVAVVAQVRPGEIFGEMALLEEMPRTLTALASENTTVYMLLKSKLDGLLINHPRTGVVIIQYLARILSTRLRAVMSKTSQDAPK